MSTPRARKVAQKPINQAANSAEFQTPEEATHAFPLLSSFAGKTLPPRFLAPLAVASQLPPPGIEVKEVPVLRKSIAAQDVEAKQEAEKAVLAKAHRQDIFSAGGAIGLVGNALLQLDSAKIDIDKLMAIYSQASLMKVVKADGVEVLQPVIADEWVAELFDEWFNLYFSACLQANTESGAQYLQQILKVTLELDRQLTKIKVKGLAHESHEAALAEKRKPAQMEAALIASIKASKQAGFIKKIFAQVRHLSQQGKISQSLADSQQYYELMKMLKLRALTDSTVIGAWNQHCLEQKVSDTLGLDPKDLVKEDEAFKKAIIERYKKIIHLDQDHFNRNQNLVNQNMMPVIEGALKKLEVREGSKEHRVYQALIAELSSINTNLAGNYEAHRSACTRGLLITYMQIYIGSSADKTSKALQGINQILVDIDERIAALGLARLLPEAFARDKNKDRMVFNWFEILNRGDQDLYMQAVVNEQKALVAPFVDQTLVAAAWETTQTTLPGQIELWRQQLQVTQAKIVSGTEELAKLTKLFVLSQHKPEKKSFFDRFRSTKRAQVSSDDAVLVMDPATRDDGLKALKATQLMLQQVKADALYLAKLIAHNTAVVLPLASEQLPIANRDMNRVREKLKHQFSVSLKLFDIKHHGALKGDKSSTAAKKVATAAAHKANALYRKQIEGTPLQHLSTHNGQSSPELRKLGVSSGLTIIAEEAKAKVGIKKM